MPLPSPTQNTNVSTHGLHHLGLTVPNIHNTADFFESVLGYKRVGEKPDYPAIFISDGITMLTLWQVQTPQKMVHFDRKQNVGLHHFAIKVGGIDQLETLQKAIEHYDGATLEFAPEALNSSPVTHMMVTIPGGLRVEFIALPEG
ncbi:VOC family protein [Teredinibacter purpureus]|uniref:VOC family protein n=1 Tax=Teredinibacter purpureus TaxID=2731756 RepID=UPI0005F83178|nr:VOC family protein [Teredinibacter purpureus]